MGTFGMYVDVKTRHPERGGPVPRTVEEAGFEKPNCPWVAVITVNSYSKDTEARVIVSDAQKKAWEGRKKLSTRRYISVFRNYCKMAKEDIRKRFGVEMERIGDLDETKIKVEFVNRRIHQESRKRTSTNGAPVLTDKAVAKEAKKKEDEEARARARYQRKTRTSDADVPMF
jgi:hypothetical protein